MRFRTGSSWADLLESYGPRTTLYNVFSRQRVAASRKAKTPLPNVRAEHQGFCRTRIV